jgi:putative PIN family toxin of toxin-antitoxin system
MRPSRGNGVADGGIARGLGYQLLVSGLAYPESIPGRILSAGRQGGIDLVLSRFILDEMVRVLPRLPRITLNASEIRDLTDSFLFLAEIVKPVAEWDERLRDPSDQQVLRTLRAAKADYLVTGDKDLLALAELCPIITPVAFWQRHGY